MECSNYEICHKEIHFFIFGEESIKSTVQILACRNFETNNRLIGKLDPHEHYSETTLYYASRWQFYMYHEHGKPKAISFPIACIL